LVAVLRRNMKAAEERAKKALTLTRDDGSTGELTEV
jgi:hypothetical protein